jgi:hypothetical protein
VQQFRLKARTHLANLVQKHSTVIGEFELAWLAAAGAGKRTLVISEQFGFQQFVRQSGTIHSHKRAMGSIRVPVNVAGEHVFPDSRLAQDQDVNIRLSDTLAVSMIRNIFGFEVTNPWVAPSWCWSNVLISSCGLLRSRSSICGSLNDAFASHPADFMK